MKTHEHNQGAWVAVAIALVLWTVAGVFSFTHAAAPAAQQVVIEQFKFNPPSLTVPVGTTITWVNKDSVSHTVTSSQGFGSDKLEQGGTFSHTFSAAGTYNYACKFHPRMTGTVVVQ